MYGLEFRPSGLGLGCGALARPCAELLLVPGLARVWLAFGGMSALCSGIGNQQL